MQNFEKYHPIMSRHYTLDWLTAFKLKEIYALRRELDVAEAQQRPVDADITVSAHFVNRAMALVMGNQALLYGIRSREEDTLLATFGFYGFSTDRQCATVRMANAANADNAVLSEILPRMVGFAVHELGLSRLVAGQIVRPADEQLYLANHFERRSDGRLVLHASAILNDEEYDF
jgi:hypothetical protein